jgi:hypothetical protein
MKIFIGYIAFILLINYNSLDIESRSTLMISHQHDPSYFFLKRNHIVILLAVTVKST